MRAGELDIDIADAGHADEIVGPGQETGESRGERNGAARGESHRRSDHDLLGDEMLEETIGERLLEDLAEGGIADIGIEGDDPRIGLPQLRQRRAVCLTRRDAVAERVGRRRHRRHGRRRRFGGGGPFGLLRDRHRIARLDELAFELGDGAIHFLALLEGLAVPAALALDRGDPLALDRARQDHRRPAGRLLRRRVRVEERGHVVAVDRRSRSSRRPASGAA